MADRDPALDALLGRGDGTAPTPAKPVKDPALDGLLNTLQPRTMQEAKLMQALAATTPAGGTDVLSEAPMMATDIEAGLLASKGILAASRLFRLPGIGRFLTGAASGLAKLPSLAASGAWQGALASEINRLFGEETPAGTAAAVGAGVNALTGGIGSALYGNAISAEAAQRALAAREAGIDVRTGNVPGASFAARFAGRATGATSPDAASFTKHIMQATGSNEDTLSGPSLQRALQRLQGSPGNAQLGLPPVQGEFERLAAAQQPITWQSAPGLRASLADIVTTAQNDHGLQTNPDEMRRVLGQVQNVVTGLDNGGLTGEQYQAMTNGNSALAALERGRTAGSYLAGQLRRGLNAAASEADPTTAQALALARNQYHNIQMLEPRVDKIADVNGLVDPQALARTIKNEYENFAQASSASARAGQPTDLGMLGEAGARFGAQPVARPSLATTVGLGAGLGTLGAGEWLGGLPIYENLMHHPLLSLGLGAGTLGALGSSLPVGALQNSPLATAFILSRASRGLGPVLSGMNPLIAPAVTSQGSHVAGSGEQNWSNWLRGQSFLESPNGAASTRSSAKGYFQFLDSTAQQAQDAGLPNPQHGSYQQQADATRAFIERFYPRAAASIEQGDFANASARLAPIWPSLPGGSQPQRAAQYEQWNKILQGVTNP